jgi:hypothetical protein
VDYESEAGGWEGGYRGGAGIQIYAVKPSIREKA